MLTLAAVGPGVGWALEFAIRVPMLNSHTSHTSFEVLWTFGVLVGPVLFGLGLAIRPWRDARRGLKMVRGTSLVAWVMAAAIAALNALSV
jgi:hypothetical protein